MAKALLAIFLLTFAICSALGQEYVRGYPVNNFRRGLARAVCENAENTLPEGCTPPETPCAIDDPRTKCTCKDSYGPKCHSDCYTLLTCLGAATPIENKCSSMDSAKPYCTGNSCTATMPTGTCDKPKTDFTCTSEGQFPNLANCNEYFFCTAPNADAELYMCPANYAYDSKTGFCKQRKVVADCQTIKCVAGTPPYQVFAADKSILIFCNPPDQILFRCKDPVNMEYNSTTLQCEFICKAEGRFPDKEDPNSFYECFRSGTKFEYLKQKCPGGYVFSETQKICKAPPPAP